jgi:hypothetical protein
MSVQSKAERLFEFISQVYSIDLPANRDVTKYGMELWWQGDIVELQNYLLIAARHIRVAHLHL